MNDSFASAAKDSVIRSEERMRVSTGTFETGKIRLGKHIVTEEVTLTVPVSHEEFRLDREPISAGNQTRVPDDAVLSEEEYDVILYAERPVVRMETVPIERIKVRKVIVTAEQDIKGDLRKERIATDFSDGTSR
ncbi:YsnF/AvaK domain-containing protein [Arthrobacter sp. H14-L1]|uniref:YsnF/AvaK domain-containing protein n=1 Tax=Arthrobacter sp. H14-L1 TaxID=2996697 RepID=UPI00226ED831|nr:YsnF/AvaK domain-containing protein [Arthrobacter sp. H14-L1]MCY0905318.1 YsnF/AvaK domain-containing protein [Arthrobacter sp. H14-L1]